MGPRLDEAGGMVVLCEYCQRPFPRGTGEASAGVMTEAAGFALCPECERLRGRLAVLTCSGCGRKFPRLRKRARARVKQGCQRVFCPACRYPAPEEAHVQVTCTECGYLFWRLRRREEEAEHRGYRRRICPSCHTGRVVRVTCCRCGKQFVRWYWRVQQKRRLGYQRAVCPECSRGKGSG